MACFSEVGKGPFYLTRSGMLWSALSFYKATRKVLEAPRSKSYVCRPTLQQKADLDALPNPCIQELHARWLIFCMLCASQANRDLLGESWAMLRNVRGETGR